ncbi:hypothetical protein BaRGS_00022975, partial [Batillaria attramentaria]
MRILWPIIYISRRGGLADAPAVTTGEQLMSTVYCRHTSQSVVSNVHVPGFKKASGVGGGGLVGRKKVNSLPEKGRRDGAETSTQQRPRYVQCREAMEIAKQGSEKQVLRASLRSHGFSASSIAQTTAEDDER